MFFILFTLMASITSMTIYDFSAHDNFNEWRVVDDGVMGGQSEGSFVKDEDGHGNFSGDVSLENNGGFSSVRYRFKTLNVGGFTSAKIKLKGDGKKYQFRVKSDSKDLHAYKYEFVTTGLWETIEIPLAEMIPTFRGMRPNLPNYPIKNLSEVGFLIGNKQKEQFSLTVASITLI